MSQSGIVNIAGGGGGGSPVMKLTGDTGGPITPTANNINILGNPDILVAGTLATSTLQLTDLVKWTPFVVDSTPGSAPYSTIQSAITAAEAAGGNKLVLVRPGSTSTYTENLTFTTGTVDVLGAECLGDSGQVIISGVHTPPASGHLVFRNFKMSSATHILSSNVAGSAGLVFIDCAMGVTNGFTFNLPNWTGFFECFDIGEQSTNNGCVNNTGGASIFFFAASLGKGTGQTMVTSGAIRMDGVDLGCPWNAQTGTSLTQCDRCTFFNAVTFSNNSTGNITTSFFKTGSSASFTMSSSASVGLFECTMNSSANPVIAGSGAGTLTLGGITFVDGKNIAGTLTVAGATGFIAGTNTAYGVLCGGTISGGPIQSVAALGSSGDVLTSNGAGMLPTFQPASGGGITSITGDSGSTSGPAVTLKGGVAAAAISNGIQVNIDGADNITVDYSSLTFAETDGSGNGAIYVYDNISAKTFLHNFSASGVVGGNVFLGYKAGNLTSTASDGNTGIGAQVLVSLDTGDGNTIVGNLAGNAITSGNSNDAFGAAALNICDTGSFNVAIGAGAMNGLTSGQNNCGVGQGCGVGISSGQTNVILGNNSYANSNGSGNIIIGDSSGNSLSGTDSNNIIIAESGTSGDSGRIRIGTNGTHTTCFVQGIAGVTVASSAAVLINTSTGQLGTVVSSRRYKENIIDIGPTSSILDLRPVIFNYKNDESKEKKIGLIAEEVEKVFPGLVVYKDGQPETVAYHDLPVLLLNEIKRLSSKVSELEKKILKN